MTLAFHCLQMIRRRQWQEKKFQGTSGAMFGPTVCLTTIATQEVQCHFIGRGSKSRKESSLLSKQVVCLESLHAFPDILEEDFTLTFGRMMKLPTGWLRPSLDGIIVHAFVAQK